MLVEQTFQANNSNDAADVATSLIKLDKAKLIIIEQEANDKWRIKAIVDKP